VVPTVSASAGLVYGLVEMVRESAQTWLNAAVLGRLRVKPHWGNVSLGVIGPSAVQQWFSDLGCGTADAKPVGASVVRPRTGGSGG
jgi:hypothetical protein